jgi:hypothetical protein
MSRNIIFVLTYHFHKLLDLMLVICNLCDYRLYYAYFKAQMYTKAVCKCNHSLELRYYKLG